MPMRCRVWRRPVGVPVAALQAIPVRWDGWADIGALAPAPAQELRGAALIGRPEIVRALREYDLAEIGLQNEVAKRWPEVHLTPGYAWGGNGAREDPLNGFTQETALGLNFELPLFNQHQGPIGEALARRDAAGQHLIAVQAELFEQIDRAELAWPRARGAWDDAAAVVAIADRQQAAEQRSFAAGAGDRASLVSARMSRPPRRSCCCWPRPTMPNRPLEHLKMPIAGRCRVPRANCHWLPSPHHEPAGAHSVADAARSGREPRRGRG